jgi:hypothetical protein
MLAALVAGVGYCVIGRAFAAPVHHRQAWRLAAWAVSGILFAAQIAFEHFMRRSSARTTALHASMAAALGAFLLALTVTIHLWSTSAATRPTWLLALSRGRPSPPFRRFSSRTWSLRS